MIASTTPIHATGAVLDSRDIHHVFLRGRREPLVLNAHVRASAMDATP